MKPIKTRKPREQKHDFKDGFGRVPARRHTNGKGWIANTAVVEDSVYVGPRCQVYNNAYISGSVRLEGQARVYGSATVSGNVIIKQNGCVHGRAVVRDQTFVADSAVITGSAHVSGQTRMFNNARVCDSAQVISCTLRDTASIYGAALLIRSNISGAAVLRANCVVINSIIDGNVTVEGFGQVLGNSGLRSNNSPHHIRVTDNVIIADGSQIWVPIEFRQHAVVARCNISFFMNQTDEVLRVGGTAVLHHRQFRAYTDLSQFLELVRSQPDQVYRPQQNQNQAVSVQAPRPINYLETSAGPRRVQRLQEAAT